MAIGPEALVQPGLQSKIMSQNTNKLGLVVRNCNLNTWEVGAGGSEVQGHPKLHRKSDTTQGCYMIPYLKKQTKNTKQ